MNSTLKVVYSILIVILITALIWIFVSYYYSPIEVTPENITYTTPDVVNSGTNDAEMIVSTETKNEEVSSEPTTDKVVSPVIVSSENKTSDSEKQQVLSEIDATLKDLLKIVDKVPTVDESKLGVDEEEVQQ